MSGGGVCNLRTICLTFPQEAGPLITCLLITGGLRWSIHINRLLISSSIQGSIGQSILQFGACIEIQLLAR